MLTPKPLLGTNRGVLRSLGIKLSPEASACLAKRAGDAPAFRTVLSVVDLRSCKSARDARDALNQGLIAAMIGRGDALLQKVSLAPLETPIGHYKLHLELKTSRGII